MGHLHEAFVAQYPEREAEALKFDQHTEPKPLGLQLAEMRLALARANQQVEDLTGELQTAVNEACNNYWYSGHAERVKRLYGIEDTVMAPDCLDALRVAHQALTGTGDKDAAAAQIAALYATATGCAL